jgi:hypothetical protein
MDEVCSMHEIDEKLIYNFGQNKSELTSRETFNNLYLCVMLCFSTNNIYNFPVYTTYIIIMNIKC